ncbi:MAG: DNA repair protein RecN [Sporichthyaceae bacterium]
MIEEIVIRGLGVISEAVLELGPGLTVLTGETGAGKTMVMSGLGLLFGGRSDGTLVRSESARLSVEGRIRIDPDGPVAARVHDAGGELEDGDILLVGRIVLPESRSRAWVGGAAAPIGLLAELANDLVTVHGQHEQQGLARPGRAREVLDRFGGADLAAPLAEYRETYAELKVLRARLADVTGRAAERAVEADGLRFGLEEIAAVDPQPGEDATLVVEIARLGNAADLGSAARSAQDALRGDPTERSGADALGLIGHARSALAAAADHDPQLGALAERLTEIAHLANEVSMDLASYAAGIDVDPARLDAAQERLAALTRLCRKYGPRVDDVLDWAAKAAPRLFELDSDAESGDELRGREKALEDTLTGIADRLRAARTSVAGTLAAQVEAELAALAMPQAKFVVVVEPSAPGPDGADDVEFRLAPHPGAPARPIHKGASGGELSRIMLALQVVLAGADPAPTFVFDEVDAGIGGKAAVEVGARLARLARTSQVLVVTHLPQVAAFADAHLLVEKDASGEVTRTAVTALNDRARLTELSRMLAGDSDSKAARTHAKELLAAAAAQRAG